MLTLSNLSMRFGSKVLFEDVNLQLNPNRRYGLVGANGTGKSTLLKVIPGELEPDHGNISSVAHLSIGSMAQDHFIYEENDVLDVVLKGKPQLWEALEKQKELINNSSQFGDNHCKELEQIEITLSQQNGYQAESMAAKLLEGLGIPNSKHRQSMKKLSGGYKLRVLLAQLLFANDDLLLLDEPTNHLDLFTINWLETFLQTFKGSLVVVSHDRTFLNNVCTDIFDIDHGTIRHYPTSYDKFIEQKSELLLQHEKQILNQEKKRDHLMEFVQKFGAKATKARQAQSKLHLVEKLNQNISENALLPSSRRSPHINFIVDKTSGVRVLKVEELSKAFGDNKVLEKVSIEIERGEKVAFLGANGIGKTTFLEVIVGNSEASSGNFAWGINVNYSYFPQDPRRQIDMSLTPLETLSTANPYLSEQELRNELGRVLLEGDVAHQKNATLSGGEVARLLLAVMSVKKANVLIFDEPTNHLDMESIEVLLEALNTFQGTVLLVSHNRYFVSSFAERIIEIQPTGIMNYACTYNEYIEKRQLDLLSREKNLPRIISKGEGRDNYEKMKEERRRRTQLEREIQALEEKCSFYENEIKMIDEIMADINYYSQSTREEQFKLISKKKELEKNLEDVIALWEKANKLLDS